MARSLFVAGTLALALAACTGAPPSASNLCPTPSTFCEGNTLVHCRTNTSGIIPEPELTRSDCGSNRLCVPDQNGARCR